MESETDQTALLANMAALLFATVGDVNWAGFYVLKPCRQVTEGQPSQGELVLGPFQGRVACSRIPLNKGVCGAAASKRKTLRVADVHAFPEHIACDGASRSEIVVPLCTGQGKLFGVLDIDSPTPGRFSATDQAALEQLASLLGAQLGRCTN
nr:GAF domain-containing protein [Formicincola oecophyllae]